MSYAHVDEAVLEKVKEQAKSADHGFADHEVETLIEMPEEKFFLYRCRKPGTIIYGFDVFLKPGYLFFSGDIGELILNHHSAKNVLNWFSGAARCLNYVHEKVPNVIRKGVTKWDPQLADMAIKDLVDECVSDEENDEGEWAKKTRKKIDEFNEQWEWAEQSEPEFVMIYWDIFSPDEGPCTEQFTSRFLFQLEALKWLYNRLEKERDENQEDSVEVGAGTRRVREDAEGTG